MAKDKPTIESLAARVEFLEKHMLTVDTADGEWGAMKAKITDMFSVLAGHQRALEQVNVVFAEANANVVQIEKRLDAMAVNVVPGASRNLAAVGT